MKKHLTPANSFISASRLRLHPEWNIVSEDNFIVVQNKISHIKKEKSTTSNLTKFHSSFHFSPGSVTRIMFLLFFKYSPREGPLRENGEDSGRFA